MAITEPQRRHQRHGRSRKAPTQSSVQAQPIPDAQSGSAENTSGALFDSARNTLINGGQFTAAANVTRNMTININDGVTPQIQNESGHSQQTKNHSRNRRRGPMRPRQVPMGRAQRSNEIYERHLKEKERGHPLWIPQPNMVLPIPYRAQGVRVGDVGILTGDGGFDFLFNICVSRDDPINPKELPDNFVPIHPSINPIDIRKFAQFSPGSYLASSSVAESRTAEQNSGLTFESSASEGAILAMPEGAYSEDLSNFSRLNKYIATHAEDWYKFVNGPRGREAQNGDLRVVVGCDKTTSWGMATFANSSLSHDTNFWLKFSTLGEQPSQRNAGNRYVWEHSGVAEVKIGPGRDENEELGETDSNRLQNQCLFLRTLNVTLAEKAWREIFPQTVAAADQNNSYSGIHDQSMRCPHGSGTGHSHSQQPQSNSSQNLPSDFTGKKRTLNDFVPPNPLESPFGNPKLSRYEEIQCDSAPTLDVILTRSSSYNRVLHPSNIISQYLLEQFPHARVAVTHDRDWSAITGMDSCHSDPSQLLSVVHSMNDIVLDDDTGLVSLELKERDQAGILSEETKVAELIESIKDGRLTLDQYLFGFNEDHCMHLQDLCNALRSGSTDQPMPMSSLLTGHPERPLSLDELLGICNGDSYGSTQRQSIVSLRAALSLFPSQHTDRPSCLLRFADALLRRFSQWAQRDDLEEAIWSYQEALSLIPNSHYLYLETLLGLCSSLYQRFYLLGHADDLKHLLRYLELQYDLLNQRRSLLAPVESQLEKILRDSGSTENGPEVAQSEVEVDSCNRISDTFTIPMDDHLRPQQSYKKKALLVGISGRWTERGSDISRPLRGPHRDIRDMRQLLIDFYGYDPDNITLLINTDDPEQAQPTKKNIEQHCVDLVAGACKGDRFFFHFAGNTVQRPTHDEEEEDGKDEYILTCDDEIIQDNSLRKMLVDTLPSGATLVAVFDACHPGTLLDLDHYRCNRVYVPWIKKGFRQTGSRKGGTVGRRNALFGDLRSTTTDARENSGLPALDFSQYENSMSMNSVTPSPTTLPAQIVGEIFPIRPIPWQSMPILNATMAFHDPLPPELFCTGHCRNNVPQPQPSVKADVICLSSAMDLSRSRNPRGYLTQALIKFLMHKPGVTIGDVLTAVSHELHAFHLDLHQDARQYMRQIRDANKRRWARGKQPFRQQTVEIDNFQDPQISSHIPLDMKRRWEM